jgi:hypothetical protein
MDSNYIRDPVHQRSLYEGVSKSFRTCSLERELQMVQLSAIRRSCNAILWVSLVSFAAITLYVASQRAFILLFISLSTQSGNFWILPRALNEDVSFHKWTFGRSTEHRWDTVRYPLHEIILSSVPDVNLHRTGCVWIWQGNATNCQGT